MTSEQAAAYVHAQSVAALAEIEGMKAENADRDRLGLAVAYVHKQFISVIDQYGISHNAVLTTFANAYS